MTLTRRDITKLGLAAALAGAGSTAFAAPTADDWAQRLTDALNAALGSRGDSQFQTQSLQVKTGKVTTIEATVHLTWAPGYRSRRVTATGGTEAAAFAHLVTASVAQFQNTGVLAQPSA
jgi:hypothetical protein